MNSLTSQPITTPNPVKDLQNHENFTIDWIKIYSELVECAEHFVLACAKNPWFTSKIINAEYDLLIWDDVSGRPVTLMIKHIIDYYSNIKWLDKKAKCIYIDNPKLLSDKYKNSISKNFNKPLICTENIIFGTTTRSICDNFWISEDVNIFSQVSKVSKLWNMNIICWISADNCIDLCQQVYTPKVEWNFNTKKNLWISSVFSSKWHWFSGKIPGYDPHLALAYRQQIKLLSKYIIKNYLKT